MSVGSMLNLSCRIYRPVLGISSLSGEVIPSSWSLIGDVACTIQGISSRQAVIAGANRSENSYTLFAEPGSDIRPHDRVDILTMPDGENIEGIAGRTSPSPYAYVVESGPVDQAGRGRVLKYTVLKSSATGNNS